MFQGLPTLWVAPVESASQAPGIVGDWVSGHSFRNQQKTPSKVFFERARLQSKMGMSCANYGSSCGHLQACGEGRGVQNGRAGLFCCNCTVLSPAKPLVQQTGLGVPCIHAGDGQE